MEWQTDEQVLYIGYHRDANAADTDPSHMVKKFGYDGSGRTNKIQTLFGAWSDRATLSW